MGNWEEISTFPLAKFHFARGKVAFFSLEVCIFSPLGTSHLVRKTFFPLAKFHFARGKKVFLTSCEVPRGEKIHTSREKKPISSLFPIEKSYNFLLCQNEDAFTNTFFAKKFLRRYEIAQTFQK